MVEYPCITLNINQIFTYCLHAILLLFLPILQEYYTIRETIYGPVLNNVTDIAGDRPVAMRWVALDSDDET